MKMIFLTIALIPTILFSQLGTSFEGTSFSGQKPPDPVIAVGANHVVLAVNSKLAIYEKDGNFLSEQSFASIFSSISPQPTGNIFDPKIVYDQYSDRFILLALCRTPINRFLLAVTETSDPTGNWYKFAFDNESLFKVDYPGLGYDETSIVLTSHSLDLGSGDQHLPEIVILNKQELYTNNVVYRKDFVDFSPYPSKIKPARVLGASNSSKIYLIDTKSPSEIRIWSITNPLGGSNASLGIETTISLGSGYTQPQNAVQKGESTNIEISNSGSSISDVVCKDGVLYGAYTIANTSGNGTSIKYFAIDIDDNFSIKTNGLIQTNNIFYYFPVIHPDESGNMVLVFNKSSANDYAGIAYTKCNVNSSTHGTISWLKQGAAGYELLLNDKNRWGDYSGIAMDPENNYRIWIYGEWAKTTNQWGTWVGEINTSETKDFHFTNKYENTNLGGSLIVNNAQINSGESIPLETGTNYSAITNNERFVNWNSSGANFKQNNWNDETEKYYLEYGFEAKSNALNHKSVFNEIHYSKLSISAEGAMQPNDGDISFNDPWYVKSDGSQYYPSNSTDKYWINATNGFYEPNGKYGATEKGVFLGQAPDANNPSKPYYSVKTNSPQTINNRNYYFVNWEATPSGSAGFQNANALETPVVFNQTGATVKAVMKGTGISNNGSSYNNNNQRKIVKTLNGYLHAVYESMGHVWYERSIDNGSTWALMNNAKPISGYSGKSPSLSIDSQDNDYFFLVYQEEVPTATLTERAIVVSRIKYTGVITYSEMVATLISSSTVLDCEPVISSSEEDYLVVYKVLNSTSGQNDGLYYYLYTRAADPNVFNYSSFGLVQQTTAVSVHPSLVSLNITHTPSDYHIVWQQGSTSGSSSIKYTKMVWNGQAMSFLYYSEPSSTSGYSSNFNPSIAITLNRPRVVWLTENPYTYILEGNLRTGNLNTWGTLTRFSYGSGNSVESINVNARNVDYGFVVGYAGDGQAVRYYKPSVNLVAQPTRYDNYVQLSNGVNYTDMAIQTFNTTSAPYYFNSTTVDATLSKTSSANEAIKGREIVFNNGKSNLIFEVNNIKVDENAIDFVEIEDTTVTKSNEEAISLFETESFSLTDKSNFSFDVNYTLIDKENLEEQFGFEYQLVDANTNLAIGVLEKIETSKLDSEEESSVSYTINTEGIGNKQVKLKLVVAKDVADNVAIISTFSTKSDLAKSSNKVISFDETLSITDYALEQNYPNPFNPSTIIKYQIPNDGLVTMKIYDITGQEVKTLVNESQAKGRYEINFDASNLSTGVYFYRLTSGSFTKSMKMLLIK